MLGPFEDGAKETAKAVEEHGVRSLAVKCDVSQPDQVKAALEKTIDVFGKLDFAFDNAGVEQPTSYTVNVTEPSCRGSTENTRVPKASPRRFS